VYGITVFGDAVNSGEVIARWFMDGIMTPFSSAMSRKMTKTSQGASSRHYHT